MTEEMQKALRSVREESKDIIVDSAKTSIHSKFTGEIIDIKVYTTSELKDLDPSLRKIVQDYWNKIKKRNSLQTVKKKQSLINIFTDYHVYNNSIFYTKRTALIHPSFSGLFVTCAYLPQMTFPPCVTNPNSLTFTSMIVPFVITPSPVYNVL